MKYQFSSENFDKTHPSILKALIECNNGFAPSYGQDEYTFQALNALRKFCGIDEIDVFFCFNGTGANNFALSAITNKYHAILCSDVSHLYRAESTAPEAITGCRLYPVSSKYGKIEIEDLQNIVTKSAGMHSPLPSVLTITQPTEYGTVYTLNELKQISGICSRYNLLLHIDGARLLNALCSLSCSMSEFINTCRPDVITLGGTKCGLMFGEAVIFIDSGRFNHLSLIHKRSMQLASKNRFIAVQFEALLQENRWNEIASYTNDLAKYFESLIKTFDQSYLLYPVETNTVFLKMNSRKFKTLSKFANFYQWKPDQEEVRFVFSFSNSKNEIQQFFNEYTKVK